MAGGRRARKSRGRLTTSLGENTAYLVRGRASGLSRSDSSAYGLRVRPELAALLSGADTGFVSGDDGIGEAFSDGFFWSDNTGWIDD